MLNRGLTVKRLDDFVFDQHALKDELAQYAAFLSSQVDYGERDSILPFFQQHQQLSAALGILASEIQNPDMIAFELDLIGRFKADLVIGNKRTSKFCFVEFEDAKSNSLFVETERSTKKWSPRLEGAFGQVLDWFNIVESLNRTGVLTPTFGNTFIEPSALIVLGRDVYLDQTDRDRLDWRTRHVVVASKKVYFKTFDQVLIEVQELGHRKLTESNETWS
jgi:hypothetical protein